MKYYIRKTIKGKKFLYEVLNEKNELIGKRLSGREYVACLVQKYKDGSIKVLTWFGRLDLIGKGYSSRYSGNVNVTIAYREVTDMLTVPAPK